MTPYERGFADCRERAAKVCRLEAAMVSGTGRLSHHAKMLGERILSLQPEAGADQRAKGEDSRTERSCENGAAHPNPGEQECVMVPLLAWEYAITRLRGLHGLRLEGEPKPIDNAHFFKLLATREE